MPFCIKKCWILARKPSHKVEVPLKWLVAVGGGKKAYFFRIFFSLLYANIFSVFLASKGI